MMHPARSFLKVSMLVHWVIFMSCKPPVIDYTTWQVYSGDRQGTKYSALDQINKHNVNQLKPVWIYNTGDMRDFPPSTIQCNPIVVGNKMFITTPGLKLIALQASTGKELWVFDPDYRKGGHGVSRGVTYWSDGVEARLFFVAGSNLYCLDPKSGDLIHSFGDSGTVDLHMGLGRDVSSLRVTAKTPGIVYRDLLILGSALGEGPTPAPPGHIRAYNVWTGDMEWIFHTIPHPGEFGYETWPEDAWKRSGGANSWGGFTVDHDRGMVFCGTGSPTYDHWGGDRIGKNLFGNSILALNAETGERVWHYQVVHHDIWDYDIPCQPNLVTIRKDGKNIDAVAQATKMGHLFVLDRETGEPLFPVEERPVPQSKIPGEKSWPTQPFPPESLRYAKQSFKLEDLTNLSPEAKLSIEEQVQNMKLGDIFIPPGTDGTVIMPQFNGGTDWGGAAFDPVTQKLIVNCSNEVEWISMVRTKPNKKLSQYQLGQGLYQTLCSWCHGQGNPTGNVAPSLQNITSGKLAGTKEDVLQLLNQGKGQMPKFALLSSTEKQAIIAFLWKEGRDVMIDTTEANLTLSSYAPYVATGHNPLKDHEGFPANAPPWGTLSSIDLNEGKINWQVPLGTYPELEARGLPPTGTFNMGGPIVTKGGLIFIGGSMDERMHAYDKDTGELLWEFQMEAGGYATPATYSVDGRQFVVIAAGGGGKPETKPGDKFYCFALPD